MSLPRTLPAFWQRLDVTVRDLPLGLLLAAMSYLPGLQHRGTELGGLPGRSFDALTALAVALQCLPLAVRRRLPALCLALVTLGFAVDQLRGYHLIAGIALPVALLSAGSHLERHRRTTALVFTTVYAALAVALSAAGPGETPVGYAGFLSALALAWGAGTWLRHTRALEAEHRRRVAEDTLLAERTRIARELHDIVTHHVTAMVVQAEAARYLTAAPDRLDRTLETVGDTGRRAIADLRQLLDLLSPSEGSGPRTPAVGRIRTLVEQTRDSGQPVEFTEEGTPAAATGSAELVAYRVVQEALTNALKYAHGSRTSVRVRHTGSEITVEVGTDGSGTRAPVAGGSGRGLAGLRERVGVLGGDFDAGPHGDGGFLVTARIPAGSAS
ncbi:sensor histidine kinase [Streptomyces sp. NPDC001478]